MLCLPCSRIAWKMTTLLAHNPMVSVRALKGGCNWKNQLFRVRDGHLRVPLYVDAPLQHPMGNRATAGPQERTTMLVTLIRLVLLTGAWLAGGLAVVHVLGL